MTMFDEFDDDLIDQPGGMPNGYEIQEVPTMSDGLVPPDIDDFDKEGTLGGSMMDALNNSQDRVGFSSLMAALFKPQLETEMEPFKGSNLTKPKQRKALGIALELFQWEYTSLGRNRLGAARMLKSQAQAVRDNDKHTSAAQYDEALDLAENVVKTNQFISYLSELPKSGHLPPGVPDVISQKSMWHEQQRRLYRYYAQLAELAQGPRSYYYYRKCWLEILNSIVDSTKNGKDLVDFTEVRAKWQSHKFRPGQLISSMPWSYNVAYRMHIESLSDGSEWRDFIIKVFTQNPGSGRNRNNNNRNRIPGARRRQNALNEANPDDY